MSEANDRTANETNEANGEANEAHPGLAKHDAAVRAKNAMNHAVGATMSIGEAAERLGMSISQVRRLCKVHERNPDEGLAFVWSAGWVPRTDVNGHRLRGHRQPYVAAVERLAEAKRKAEQDSSL